MKNIHQNCIQLLALIELANGKVIYMEEKLKQFTFQGSKNFYYKQIEITKKAIVRLQERYNKQLNILK